MTLVVYFLEDSVYERADRQRDGQTDKLIAIHRASPRGKVGA